MKQVYISIFLMFLINTIVFAEIAIGSMLTLNGYEYDDLAITNKDELPLSKDSGLKIFAGDTINTGRSPLIILVPTSSLVINIRAYTNVYFDVQELGGREYVLKINVISGELQVEAQQREDLIQVLSDVVAPSAVQRINNLKDTSSSALKLYVQFINNGSAIIDNDGLDISSGVFFTDDELDIRTLINVLNNDDLVKDEALQDILTTPVFSNPIRWVQSLRINAYFQDWENFSFLSGKYRLSLQRGKFRSTFQLPLFFTGSNYLYHPPGLNDMLFGFQLIEEQYESNTTITKVGVGTQSVLYGLLNKVEEINYGLQNDTIYAYYGKQQILHNHNSTLFMDHYKPYKTFDNNFNKDFKLGLNFNNFGNNMYVRAFQNASIYDSMANNIDIIYNRVWIRPLLPMYPLEVGVTVAGDLATNKFSEKDQYYFVKQDNSANKLLFLGVDSTVPLINNVRYQLNLNVEGGYILPMNSAWTGIIDYGNFTNYGAKGGVTNIFISNNNELKTTLFANGYFTSGLFRPHIATSGYEYYVKPLYNRLISAYRDDASNIDFSAKAVAPEVGFALEHTFYTVEFGMYYPFGISGNITELYQYPSGYVASTINLDNFNSRFFQFKANLLYSLPMAYVNVADIVIFNLDNLLARFGPLHSVYDINVELLILERYGLELGVFNTPQYTDTELSYSQDTLLPRLVGMSYATVFIKL